MTRFPDVPSEETSALPAIAHNDEFPKYTVTDCPSCGGEAYERRSRISSPELACRSCKKGDTLFQRYANYGSAWEDVRKWVLDREDRECWECGRTGELHVHHIVKLVWFETTDEAHQPKNLVALCPECHRNLENSPGHFDQL